MRVMGSSLAEAGDATFALACADFDLDGWLDVAIGNYGSANHLFRNEQGNGFRLANTPISTAADSTHTLAWGDWNADGWPDLVVGNGAQSNELFRNDAGGHNFTRITSTPIDDASDSDFTRSLGWGDYDLDGVSQVPMSQ